MSRFIEAKKEGELCLFGAPFDSTTSFRPGARFGPGALREASWGLETFSPRQEGDLEDVSFEDMGDLELPFGDPSPALKLIEETAASIFQAKKRPVLLGGEHLVTLGAVRAAARFHPGLKVVHLDAHADLRDEYLGQKLSHATVIRRVSEIIGLENIRQIGIRSCDRAEYPLMSRLKSNAREILEWAGESPCYLTIDLDILDPSCFPGTGTPEPGGLLFNDLVSILMELIPALRVVAMDLVELAPMQDPSGVSNITAAKVLREILIRLGRGRV